MLAFYFIMCVVTKVILVSLFPQIIVKGYLESTGLSIYRIDHSFFFLRSEIEPHLVKEVKLHTIRQSSKQRNLTRLKLKEMKIVSVTIDNLLISFVNVIDLRNLIQTQCPSMEETIAFLSDVSRVDLSLKVCTNLGSGETSFVRGWNEDDWTVIGEQFGVFLNTVLLNLSESETCKNVTLESISNAEGLLEHLPPVFRNFLDSATHNTYYVLSDKDERKSKAAGTMIKARNKRFIQGHQLQEALINYLVSRSKTSSILFSRQGPGGSWEMLRQLKRNRKERPPTPLTLKFNGVDNTQKENKGTSNVFGQNKNYMSIATTHISVEIDNDPELLRNPFLSPKKWLLPSLDKPSPELLQKLQLQKPCDVEIMKKSLIQKAQKEIELIKSNPNPSQSSSVSQKSDSIDLSQASSTDLSEVSSSRNSSQTSSKESSQTLSSNDSSQTFSSTDQSKASSSTCQTQVLDSTLHCDAMSVEDQLIIACAAGDDVAVRRALVEVGDLDSKFLDNAVDAACVGANFKVIEALCLVGASLKTHLFYTQHQNQGVCAVKKFENEYIPSKRQQGKEENLKYFSVPDPEEKEKVNEETRRGEFYNRVETNFTNTLPAKVTIHDIIPGNPSSKLACANVARVVKEREKCDEGEQTHLLVADGVPLSQLLDLQQKLYKCFCGVPCYGLEIFKTHWQEQHKDKTLTSPRDYLEFGDVLLVGGAGHYYMNSMKALADLIWEPMLRDFVESLSWESRNQLNFMLKVNDTHLGYQTLLRCLHSALFRKLVLDFVTWADKNAQVCDGEQFVMWIQKEGRTDHQRFEINTLLTLHGMNLFLEGLRRNNFEHYFAGISYFNFLWFIRNHPIYRQLDLYLAILRETAPHFVFVLLFVNLSFSWTGSTTCGEHVDFIVEVVNKEVKAILPKGEVTINDWMDACRSCEVLIKIKKAVYERFGMNNLKSEDQIWDDTFLEKELPNLVKTLQDIASRNQDELTYPKTLSNFRTVGNSYRNEAIRDLKDGIVAMRERKTRYVPNSFEEEKYLEGVESMTIEALNTEIVSLINAVECEVRKYRLAEQYRRHRATPGGKRVASLRSYLLSLREQLKDISES